MRTLILSTTFLIYASFSAQETIPASTKYGYLDINNAKALVRNGSLLWTNPNGTASYTINEFDNRVLAFAGNIWIGAMTTDSQLKLAGGLRNDKGTDFYVGPYSTSGVQSDFQKYDKVWKLNRAEVLEFTQRYDDDDYIIPQVILTWPAHGDTALGQAKNLAPFHDTDGNGIYNPLKGDYPDFDFDNTLPCGADKLYGDQVIYAIFHDVGYHDETNGKTLKAEIHLQAFAYATGDELNNTTFYRYTVYNRSEQDYTDFAFTFFAETEVGCLGDDYVGSSADRGLVYTFTGQQYDGNGGATCTSQPWNNVSPIFGLDFVSTPKPKADSFGHYISSCSSGTLESITSSQFYRNMNSLWKDNTHFVEGGNGHSCGGGTTETDYLYNDNIGWTEYSEGNTFGDRKLFFTVRDMEFKRNTPLTFVVAAMFEHIPLTDYEPSQMNLINKLKPTDDKIQAFADANFPYCERTLAIDEVTPTIHNNVEVSIFPNPNNGKGKLVVSGINDPYKVEIFDVSGKLVFSQENVLTKEFEFSLTSASGYYTYKVSADKTKPFIGKLIIE